MHGDVLGDPDFQNKVIFQLIDDTFRRRQVPSSGQHKSENAEIRMGLDPGRIQASSVGRGRHDQVPGALLVGLKSRPQSTGGLCQAAVDEDAEEGG